MSLIIGIIVLVLIVSGIFFGTFYYIYYYREIKDLSNINGICLTFDDGPHPIFTPQILDILKSHNIKATFFLIGQAAKKYPEIVKRIYEEGHSIGNHSWSHNLLLWGSYRKIYQEVVTVQNFLKEKHGICPKYFRPPYGVTGPSLKKVLEQEHLKIIYWTCSMLDWKPHHSKALRNRFLNYLNKSTVYLMHDGVIDSSLKTRQATVDILNEVIPIATNQGFRFLSLDEATSTDLDQQ